MESYLLMERTLLQVCIWQRNDVFSQHYQNSFDHLLTSFKIQLISKQEAAQSISRLLHEARSQPYGSRVQRKFSCLPARFIGVHYHKVLWKEKCNRYSKKPYLSFFLQNYSVDQWWEWKDKEKMIYLPIPSHNRFFYCRNTTMCLRLPEANPPLLDIG